MISGSSIERVMMCPASEALPRASRTGAAAIIGAENHEKVELGLVVGGDLSAQPKVVQWAMEGATAVDVEVAYAINVETEMVRIIGRRIGRNYGKLEVGEIPLTVDAIITKPDGGVWVWDWKTRERVTAAKENWQIRAAAVAAMKTLGLHVCGGALGYLADDHTDTATFDTFDMTSFFADTRAMLKRVEAAKEATTPGVAAGPWCKYCPATPYCPAQTRLALTMIGELEDVKGKVAFMAPEQVSRAWDIKKRIEKMLEDVDEALRLRISQEVIPRPNGKRLALVDCKRKSDDMPKMKERLAALGEDLEQYKKTVEYTQVKEIKS